MIDAETLKQIADLKPSKSKQERWKQYSNTVHRLVFCVSLEDRDKLVKMVADQLKL